MRIVVDMQRAQRALVEPGLGDFDLKVAQYLARTRGDHELVLLLSDLYPDTIEPMRGLFRAALGPRCTRTWFSVACWDLSPGPANWRLACAKLVKKAAVAALKPDAFIVPVGLAGGAMDVTGMPVFPRKIPTLAVIEPVPDAVPGLDLPQLHRMAEWGFCGARASAGAPAADSGIRHAAIELPVSHITGAAGSSQAGPAARLWQAAADLVRKPFDGASLSPGQEKPRLAYVSPLPPEQSGIADYSAALVPALSRFYRVDLIAAPPLTTDPWLAEHCATMPPEWLVQNQSQYDRVVYHFGNSKFHAHMFDLLAQVPGIVVLHDFFLGDVQLSRELEGLADSAWTRALYASHGYGAVVERFDESKKLAGLSSYPANLEVLQQAQGVIVHSEYARRLADDFYGPAFPVEWSVVPLARPPQQAADRAAARKRLGLAAEDFIVCSVGFINRAKLHDRIVEAWGQSALAQDAQCRLFFVGGMEGAYGASLAEATQAEHLGGRVQITGWVDGSTYHDYLAAADLAVQLRSQSRGETSAAVLDCMSHGLATIVNANGSMADLPADAVERLADEFTVSELVQALERLWRQPQARSDLGSRARRLIEHHHAPEVCALQYAAAIENFSARAPAPVTAVARALGAAAGADATDRDFAALALALARSVPAATPCRQLLVDVSAIARADLKTGIQRVVRALVWEFIKAPPPGFRVEPVYMTNEGNAWHYRYARAWTCGVLGISSEWADDEAADFGAGDVLLVADFTSGFLVEGQRTGMFQTMRDAGVKVIFTVYDLLPIEMPDMFPPGTAQMHVAWLSAAMAAADAAVCISRSVATGVTDYLEATAPQRAKPLKVDWFHLGANLDQSVPTGGLPDGAAKVLSELAARPSFLMVGTVEPRKGYAQTLDGFEQLWKRGHDLNLVIVGKQGWMVDALCDRMRAHPEAGRRLFWIEGASDEYLQKLYGACRCLVAASEGEGFGLPLIEAAQHGLPIIARDIPVFREVAGEFASYFHGKTDAAIADCVEDWLKRWAAGEVPPPDDMPWLTWRQSAQRLLLCLDLDDPADDPGPSAPRREPTAAPSETC